MPSKPKSKNKFWQGDQRPLASFFEGSDVRSDQFMRQVRAFFRYFISEDRVVECLRKNPELARSANKCASKIAQVYGDELRKVNNVREGGSQVKKPSKPRQAGETTPRNESTAPSVSAASNESKDTYDGDSSKRNGKSKRSASQTRSKYPLEIIQQVAKVLPSSELNRDAAAEQLLENVFFMSLYAKNCSIKKVVRAIKRAAGKGQITIDTIDQEIRLLKYGSGVDHVRIVSVPMGGKTSR